VPLGWAGARRGLAAAAILLAATAPARAQGVQGRVVSAADSTPVSSALVVLLDAGGTRVARTTTFAGGEFYLSAPMAGRYSVAVLRIGQRPWRSVTLELQADAARRVTFAVPDEPILLEAVAVEARSTCRTSPAEGSAIGALLAEADKALTMTRLALERRDVGFYVERYRRTLSPDLVTLDSSATVEPDRTWPIRSAPPESLAVHGFVRAEPAGPDRPLGGYTYFGPDAALLVSPWFLGSHCFGVIEGRGADSGVVTVTFRPEGGRRADIEGRLVIDRATLELRRLEWSYVRLPWPVNPEGAGGAMTLSRLPTGVYVPARWWLRAPVAEVDRRHQPVGLRGWSESGGRTLPGR
jgi:hypothetical protein